MSDTLGAVHDWVCNTLKNKDWSARKWAIQAGVAPSTLQRFIAEKPWCLSQTVISKLASVSGTYPDVSPKVLVSKIKSLPVMAYKKGDVNGKQIKL